MAILFWIYKYIKYRRADKVLTEENLTWKFILSATGFVVVTLKCVVLLSMFAVWW
jgi:hypothetical protein